jgi:tRNA(Ile)-lysidine synthase
LSCPDGPGDLCVRPVRPGERIHLAGGGRRPLGRLLADAGVPARLRDRVPVVARGDEVLWLVGHRADDRALASPGAPATILSVRPAS